MSFLMIFEIRIITSTRITTRVIEPTPTIGPTPAFRSAFAPTRITSIRIGLNGKTIGST